MDSSAKQPNSALTKLSKRQRRRQSREQHKQQASVDPTSSTAPPPSSKQPSKVGGSKTEKKSRAGEPSPPQIITEGTATIHLPAHVFYNPCQVFNRDLTIAVINQLLRSRVFSSSGRKLPPLPILPAVDLSASGEANKKPLQENALATPASSAPTIENQPELSENSSDRLYGKVRILEALAASGLRYWAL